MKLTFKIALVIIAASCVIASGYTIARYQGLYDIIAPPEKYSYLQIRLSAKGFNTNNAYELLFQNSDRLEIKSNSMGEIDTLLSLPPEIGHNKVINLVLRDIDDTSINKKEISIDINTSTEKITWAGKNLAPSEELGVLLTNNNQNETKKISTDWNGNFHFNTSYAGINLINETSCLRASTSQEELCLSFNVFRSPEIIQVVIPHPITLAMQGGNSNDSVISHKPPKDSAEFAQNETDARDEMDDPSHPSHDFFTSFDNWKRPDHKDDDVCRPYDEDLALCSVNHIRTLQSELYKTYYDMSRMTLQLSAGMMQQVGFLGTLFDARQQLKTQLLLWEKQERAHEDYHPSEQMCTITTMTADLVAAEANRELTTYGLARALNFEDQNTQYTNSYRGRFDNIKLRIYQFREKYCAPSNISMFDDSDSTLRVFCAGLSSSNVARLNRDIDYTSLMSLPKTLDIDLSDGIDSNADEEDVLSMGRLLFGHKAMNFPQKKVDSNAEKVQAVSFYTDPNEFTHAFQDWHSISAIRNVPRYSFANLAGMKAKGSGFNKDQIVSLLDQFGMSAPDVDRFIGDNPSYFAQMHILTKQIYQHPNFYTNLITKEANIGRFAASMDAIYLMSRRDYFEALLRKELLLSLVVEMKIREMQTTEIDTLLRSMSKRIN